MGQFSRVNSSEIQLLKIHHLKTFWVTNHWWRHNRDRFLVQEGIMSNEYNARTPSVIISCIIPQVCYQFTHFLNKNNSVEKMNCTWTLFRQALPCVLVEKNVFMNYKCIINHKKKILNLKFGKIYSHTSIKQPLVLKCHFFLVLSWKSSYELNFF